MEDVFIGFRATHWPLLLPFLKALKELRVDKTELAKRAIEHGLRDAIRELERETAQEEKRAKQVDALLKSGASTPPGLESALRCAVA